jgi:hypothetical protein
MFLVVYLFLQVIVSLSALECPATQELGSKRVVQFEHGSYRARTASLLIKSSGASTTKDKCDRPVQNS